MILLPDGKIDFSTPVEDETLNFIEITNGEMKIVFWNNSVVTCPVSVFLGDRLSEWNEYTTEHPDGYQKIGDISLEYSYNYDWNTYDYYGAFTALTDFLNLTNYLSCKDIWKAFESYRINYKYGINIKCVCSNATVRYDFARMDEPVTMRDILFSIVHYYILNGYKLTKCKHCERWFAAQSLKNEYCERISPCYNMVVSGKPILRSAQQCEQAVRKITQKFRDRKKSIYNGWNAYYPEKTYSFLNEYDRLNTAMKAAPTVTNIVAFQEYLYSENMPKQTRPNRKHGGARNGKHKHSNE